MPVFNYKCVLELQPFSLLTVIYRLPLKGVIDKMMLENDNDHNRNVQEISTRIMYYSICRFAEKYVLEDELRE